MASTDINGTYGFMYLVTQDETFHGKTSHWDLVNDGSGSAAINPVASDVTISGAPHENGHSNHSHFSISVAGSDQFTFVSTAETTTSARASSSRTRPPVSSISSPTKPSPAPTIRPPRI